MAEVRPFRSMANKKRWEWKHFEKTGKPIPLAKGGQSFLPGSESFYGYNHGTYAGPLERWNLQSA